MRFFASIIVALSAIALTTLYNTNTNIAPVYFSAGYPPWYPLVGYAAG